MVDPEWQGRPDETALDFLRQIAPGVGGG